MKTLQILTAQAIDAGFHWRTRGGEEFLRPANMETRHVFFTWLMIWNHSCPEELVRPEGRRYTEFDPFYTPAYMAQAFRVMFNELRIRKDLRATWKTVVDEVLASYAAWHSLDDLNEVHQMDDEVAAC